MSKMVFRLLGYIGTVLGLVLLVIALVSRLYSETFIYPTETVTVYPYLDFVIPLTFLGVCWLVIGVSALSVTYASEKKEKKPPALIKVKEKPLTTSLPPPTSPKESVEEKQKPLITRTQSKPVNLHHIGFIFIGLGTILLLAAAFAYGYEKTETQYVGVPPYQIPITYTTRPYRDATFPLIMTSAAMFIPGFALLIYKSEKPQQQVDAFQNEGVKP